MRVQVWFTSDLHFGHANILKFTDREYSTIEEHDEHIITMWNKQVRPNDIVYILGDVIWSTVKNPKAILSRLNGKKHLIIGNHDRVTIRQAENIGYQSASYSSRIKIGNHFVNLYHYPYKWSLYEKAYNFFKNPFKYKFGKGNHTAKYPVNNGGWLLHGHTHSKIKEKGNTIHIGWDAWGELVSQDKILSIIEKGIK